jgi:DNA-binding response OmpR family regulator
MWLEMQQPYGRKRSIRDLSSLDERQGKLAQGATRVLVVEDERDTLMTLGILLRSEGYDVRLAHGADEVPAAMREFRPHVVLLDIGMPGRDGYEIARELKATLKDLCPLLVAVTAYGTAADRARATESGFDHHVTKPYDPADLLAILDRPRI